jgi:myo-inositol-1(or 4)-monophosphatase
MDLSLAKEMLIAGLRHGGEVLLHYFGNISQVRVKDHIGSVVTEADIDAEREIIRILQMDSGPCNFIAEESGHVNNGSPFTWVIDPLDGTSNFAAGLPWFGVIIALLHHEEPVMGGMYLPIDNMLYFAEKGKGARRNDLPIRATEASGLEQVLISYSFDHSDNPGKTEREMELLGRLSSRVRNIRSTNSLIDFCFTADGRLGGAINQSTRIWDIAAPWLVIREAGGEVSDITGRELKLDLSTGSCDRNYTILAAGRRIHPLLRVLTHQEI